MAGDGPGLVGVDAVAADEEDGVVAEPVRQAGQVEPGRPPGLVVAVSGGVEDGAYAGFDAEGGAGGADVGGGGPVQDVVAGVAVVERPEARGVGTLPGLGGVGVGGEAVVPAVDAGEEGLEVQAAGGGGVGPLVDAHGLERGAVVGLEVDGAGAFDDPAGEVDVADEVLGAGEGVPGAGGAEDGMVGAGRQQRDAVRSDEPQPADVRGEFGQFGGDGGRVAVDAAAPVRGEDREVLVDGAAQGPPVAEPGAGVGGAAGVAGARGVQGAPPVVGQAEQPVAEVRVVAEERVPYAVEAAGTVVPLRAEPCGVVGGAAEVLGGVARRQFVAAGEGVQIVADHAVVQPGPHPGRGGGGDGQVVEPLVLRERREMPSGPGGTPLGGPFVAVDEHRRVAAGDTPRQEQHRVRHVQLVVPVCADQLGVLVEQPGPDEPVAEERRHVEQVRAAGEGAGGRPEGPGEDGAGPARGGVVPPGGAVVVAQQHVGQPVARTTRLGRRAAAVRPGVVRPAAVTTSAVTPGAVTPGAEAGQAFGESGDRAVREAVGGAEELEVCPGGRAGGGRSGVGGGSVRRDADDGDAWVTQGVGLGERAGGRIVAGAALVGGDDEVQAGVRLPCDAVQTGAEVGQRAPAGHDDAELEHGDVRSF